jgi:hypothetical protein
MEQYRYEVWELHPEPGKNQNYRFRIIEYFAVCDGGFRARITNKVYATLHEAKVEAARLSEGLGL